MSKHTTFYENCEKLLLSEAKVESCPDCEMSMEYRGEQEYDRYMENEMVKNE